MRRALFLTLMPLAFASCGPGSPFCSKSRVNTQAVAPALALTDEAVSVKVALGSLTKCPSGLVTAERADVTVADGAGQPVTVTTVDVSTTETDGYAVQVGFVPRAPGRYVVTARFEPTLGTATREVLVLRNRGGATAQVLPGLEACSEVDVTGTGLLVCLTDGGRLRLFRGAVVVGDEPATGVAVAGADVWSWTPTRVARWRDAGAGGVAIVKDVFVGSDFSTGSGVVTAQGLVLVNRTRITRVVDNGPLSVNLDTVLTANLPAASGRLRLALGEGGSLALALGGTVCHLADIAVGDASCYAIGGQVLGEDSGGFWFSGESGAPPRFVTLAGTPPTPHTEPVGELPTELAAATAPGVPVWLLDGKPVAPLSTHDAFDAFTAAPVVEQVVRAAPRVLVVRAGGATQWLQR